MSTKEFFLNSKIISQGRETIANLITAFLPGSPQNFPPAAPGLLNSYLSCCEVNAASYTKYADGGRVHSDMLFNEAVSASSNATVAAEIANELHWIPRLSYALQEGEESIVTAEMRSFARDVNRLLNVMYDLGTTLRDSDNGDTENNPAEKLEFELRQRLQQALYLGELGVRVTCPPSYMFHHPDAHKWLQFRASVRRRLSESLLAGAVFDEARARQYRGKTQH